MLRLQGVSGDLQPLSLRLRAGFDWPKPDKRTEYHRARIQEGGNGVPERVVLPSRSSAVLSSVAWADGLVELPAGQIMRRGGWCPPCHSLRCLVDGEGWGIGGSRIPQRLIRGGDG